MVTIHDVLGFWFGPHRDDGVAAAEQSELWWSKNEALDAEIRRRFASAVEAAAGGELESWTADPEGRLAVIILTDQMTRNIHRGSADAFAADPIALSAALEGLSGRSDLALRPIQRVFFYLPLEHAEDLALQERCVGLFEELLTSVEPAHRSLFDGYLDYARRHRDIIRRFGRFPHRNEALRRSSSAEEIRFLEQPGSSF